MDPKIHKLPKIEAEHHQTALAMFIAGWPQCDIARETGLNENTLKTWIKREEWAKQKKAIDEKRKQLLPVENHPLVKAALKNPIGEMRTQFLENTGHMAVADSEHWKKMQPDDRLEVASSIKALHDVHSKTFGIGKEEEEGSKGHITLNFLNNADAPGYVRVIDVESERIEQPQERFPHYTEIEESEGYQPTPSTSVDDY